jgi:hypothetical protein
MPGNRPRKLSSSSQAGGDSLLWSHLPLVEFSEKILPMRNAGIRCKIYRLFPFFLVRSSRVQVFAIALQSAQSTY